MSFPRYPKYKDSGVAWLGEVPEHWEVKRLKRSLRLLTEKTDRRSNPVALENIEGWTGRFIPTETEFQGEGVAFDAGDILFGKLRPYLAKAYLAASSGEAVGDFHVMRPVAGIDSRFAQYQLLNRGFIDIVDSSTFGAKMPRASWEFVAGMEMTTPPPAEQTAIAAFLDRETAKIDGLVAEQRRLMELLKEKRQAVISHAVTKGLSAIASAKAGLNPDLSAVASAKEDAPMKPSGIEWLGDVPEHWEVKPLRRFSCLVQSGPFGSQLHADEYVKNGTPVINPTNMVDGVIVPNDEITVTESVVSRLSHQQLRAGDVVFSRRGELGRCALVTEAEDGWLCGTGSMILRLHRSEYHAGYLSRFLSLGVMRQYFESYSIGSVMDSLSSATLLATPMVVPPIGEQDEISTFIDTEAATFDALTAEAQRAVDLLQERRTALISAAVTGQIDVRQLATGEEAA